MFSKKKTIIESYKGSPAKARKLFLRDSAKKAVKGYRPVSENYTPGSYKAGDFLVALILCVVVVGFLVFIFMLIVKPPGMLTVTYKLEEVDTAQESTILTAQKEKTCPDCAESVKGAAIKCRFCGYRFDEGEVMHQAEGEELPKLTRRPRI